MGLREVHAHAVERQAAAAAKMKAQQEERKAQPAVKSAAVAQDDGELYRFVSHIEGRNATVKVFADRVEWNRPRSAFSKKDMGTEMMPVKSMSSVTTERDSFVNTKVKVIASGNTVNFRVSHAEARLVADVLTQLILGKHPAQQGTGTSAVAAPPTASFTDRLAQVEALYQQGVLTSEEHTAKRAAILAEM